MDKPLTSALCILLGHVDERQHCQCPQRMPAMAHGVEAKNRRGRAHVKHRVFFHPAFHLHSFRRHRHNISFKADRSAPNQLIVVLRPAWPWIAIAMHLAQLLRQQHSRRRADWQDCTMWAGHSEPSLEFLLCFAQGFVAFGWAHVLPSKMYPSSASVLFAICSCR